MEELTKKQKIFVKEYVKDENGTQSALKAYDTKDYKTASVIAAENLDKPSIQVAIAEVKSKLADHFKTEDIAQRIQEGLLAGKMVGKTLEPDYAVRHKYVQTVVDIRGDRAPEKNINLNIQTDITNPKARELAEEYENKLKQNL